MNCLAKFRLSPRWLVLLVGFAALAATTAAFVPHDEGIGEDLDCLVCKAGNQPLTELSVELVGEPPIALSSSTPIFEASFTKSPVIESGVPRAPPA